MSRPIVPMTKGTFHKVFAHPYHLSGVMGTVALSAGIGSSFVRNGLEIGHFAEGSLFLAFLVWFACMTCLGYVFGAIFLAWLVVAVSRRVNGSPLGIGDTVTVLVGPSCGLTTTVYELVVGQGGQSQPRIHLGSEASKAHQDIFEEYQLLRIDRSSSCLSPEP